MTQIITTCQFRHPYYPQGLLQGYELVAEPETAALMQAYGLFWRHQAEGFTLYGHHADLAGLLRYLQDRYETQQLCWKLSGDSAHFFEISELSDSSLAHFSFQLRSAATSLTDTRSADWLSLQMQQLATGNYQTAIATLCCRFADLARAFTHQEKFVYEFQARKLHWVYLLINRSQQVLHEPKIVLNDAVSFSGPEFVQLENGEAALRFSALADAYPLRQIEQPQFDLQVEASVVIDGQRQKQILLKGLPTPQAGKLSIRRYANSNQVLSSELYVYI